MTLLRWMLLRLARRRHPELFDARRAAEAVEAQLAELGGRS